MELSAHYFHVSDAVTEDEARALKHDHSPGDSVFDSVVEAVVARIRDVIAEATDGMSHVPAAWLRKPAARKYRDQYGASPIDFRQLAEHIVADVVRAGLDRKGQ